MDVILVKKKSKKELREEIGELTEIKDGFFTMLYFLTATCMADLAFLKDPNRVVERSVFLKFNVHSFDAYMMTYKDKHWSNHEISAETELVKEWNAFKTETLDPLYQEQIEKAKKKYDK